MTTDTTNTPSATLIGDALYLEFRKGGNTAQVIVTPEALVNGVYTPVHTWRRQISQWSPRKPWAVYQPDNALVEKRRQFLNEVGSFENVKFDDPDFTNLYKSESLAQFASTLNNLVNNEWELYEKPLIVEFSLEDLNSTNAGETPNALIRRIMRVRKEAGFTDELITDEEA